MKRILSPLYFSALFKSFFCHAQISPTSTTGEESNAATENSSISNVNVMNYGARGDGITDDTTTINAAMTACISRAAPNNGCVLYFPAGVYITTGLSLKSFVNMKGDGREHLSSNSSRTLLPMF